MDESVFIAIQLDNLRYFDRQVAAMPKGKVRSHFQRLIALRLEEIYKFQVESAKGHPTVQATSVSAPSAGHTEAPNRPC